MKTSASSRSTRSTTNPGGTNVEACKVEAIALIHFAKPTPVAASTSSKVSQSQFSMEKSPPTGSLLSGNQQGRDEAETARRLKAWNEPIQRIRGRIEKIFGTWKRSYGLARMRWRGLAKAGLQIRLTTIAYDIKRCSSILACA
ncbi:transposase [Labrys okinawensis]|uniref:transposase n=1 Tax=Labrys okinawensis TaxID=346911 RepID=UPI0039BC224E